MTPDNCRYRHLAADVQAHARHRWEDVLTVLGGIPGESLDCKQHPCPKCGGTDRFRMIDPNRGAVFCNKCFNTKNGDGIAAVAWMTNCNRREAIDKIGDYLGLKPQNRQASGSSVDPLDAVCAMKRMPRASAVAYGARVEGDAVAIPSWGPDGESLSDFTIRPNGSAKQRKGMWPKGGKAGVFLLAADGKPRLPQAGEIWQLVEGVKDAAALHGLDFLAVGINGTKLPQKFVKMFRAVQITLIPDRDTASIEGMESTARKLSGVATTLKVAALPAEVTPTDGKDVRDILAMPNGEQLVREAIMTAQKWEPPPSEDPAHDNRVRIFAGPKEHEVADKAVEALSRLHGLYQRGGNLVEIVRDAEPPKGIIRPPGGLYITPISEPRLLDRLSEAAQFYQIKKDAELNIAPPTRIGKIVASRHRWPSIPVIEGILHAPAFLPDGSILAQPGYCPRTGLFLEQSLEFPQVPQSPTRADAERACDELLEVVSDFPFAGPEHKAAWLALALTPAARYAFGGPTPLGAFDSNVRGSGKSKLADAIAMIHLGLDMPRTPYPDSNEEFRKQITSVLLAGEPLMLVDNVTGPLGGAAIDALLTATSWNERILGESRMTGRLAATTIWLANGNNLVFAADTARRSLSCRLESREEHPEERDGFKHPKLLAWVKEHRPNHVIRESRLLDVPVIAALEWACQCHPWQLERVEAFLTVPHEGHEQFGLLASMEDRPVGRDPGCRCRDPVLRANRRHG